MTYEEIYIKIMGHSPSKEYGIQGAFTWKDIESLMQEAVKNYAVLPHVSDLFPSYDQMINEKDEVISEFRHECNSDEYKAGYSAGFRNCHKWIADLTGNNR